MQEEKNGTLRGRLNARGLKQREGQHYDGSSINAPVTNPATIRIIMTLMLIDGMTLGVVDVTWKYQRDSRSTTMTEWFSH